MYIVHRHISSFQLVLTSCILYVNGQCAYVDCCDAEVIVQQPLLQQWIGNIVAVDAEIGVNVLTARGQVACKGIGRQVNTNLNAFYTSIVSIIDARYRAVCNNMLSRYTYTFAVCIAAYCTAYILHTSTA